MLDLLKNEEYFEFIRRDGKEASSLTAPVAPDEERSKRSIASTRRMPSRVTAIGNEWAVLRAKAIADGGRGKTSRGAFGAIEGGERRVGKIFEWAV